MRVLAGVIAALIVCLSGAEAKVRITIDKSTQRLTVMVEGQQVWDWAVSTGRAERDTPNGEFRAFRMEKDHYSKEWDDAPMPHSIFFTKKGHAIHGSYDMTKLGRPASAGCVRLHPENAARLFALVEKEGVLNTTVEVTGDVQVAIARTTRRTVVESAAPRVRRHAPSHPHRHAHASRRSHEPEPHVIYAPVEEVYQEQATVGTGFAFSGFGIGDFGGLFGRRLPPGPQPEFYDAPGYYPPRHYRPGYNYVRD